MQVTFKLYASLMPLLPPGTKGHAVSVDIDDDTTLQQLIDRFNIDDQQAFLVMVNGVYVPKEMRHSYALKDQDVVAIWPKVAGG